MGKNYNIIRPADMKPRPDKYEERVAELCAEYFKSDVAFVLRGTQTTPDIRVLKTGAYWEIKNIKGKGRHAVEDNLRKASKQSNRIIISLLMASKLDTHRVEGRIRSVLATRRMPIESVLLITKAGK